MRPIRTHIIVVVPTHTFTLVENLITLVCSADPSLGKRRHADLTMRVLRTTGICIKKGSAVILLSVPVCDPMAPCFQLCFLNIRRAHITPWVRAITIFSCVCALFV